METLKERFYNVCRVLLCTRAAGATSSSAADATYSEQPLARFRFDVAHERQRKLEVERLYLRSEDEVSASKYLW